MSITSVKLELAEAIELYEQLKANLNDRSDLHSTSEADWQSRIRTLGLDAAKLIQTSRMLDDDQLLKVIKIKEKKLARHSQWAKRHKKRVKEKRKQIQKRNENWIRETEWKVTMAPSVTTTTVDKTAQKEKNTEKSKDTSKQNRLNELSRIVTKLRQLRDLRRKRLEAKGHFFAEDGNQFYEQVQKLNATNEIKLEQIVHEPSSTNLAKAEKLVVHSEDKWRKIAIDKTAYSYWCQSDQSLDALLKNRRMWDQYILHDSPDNDLIHKVPPTFVDPAPPANWIWASYLG